MRTSDRLQLLVFVLLFSFSALGETRIRIMNANTTSGDQQSYEGSGIRMFQGLRPDIALIQEFNYGDNSPRAIQEFVATAFGTEFYYYREPIPGIPNGIVSRFPILEAGSLEDVHMSNRGLAWAKLNVPGKAPLWVFSIHLSHGDRKKRLSAARTIIEFIRREIPKNDLIMLGGDLNVTSRGESALAELKKELSDRHIPVGPEGKTGTNANRDKAYDFLLPDPNLDAHHVCVNQYHAIGKGPAPEFPDGLVFDSRTFRPLRAVAPIRRRDSAARNMQHMPIVKDFELR